MYAFPRCTDLIDAVTPEGTRIDSDQALTGYLLESAGVAVVPGSAHGMSGHVRITFAVSEADLEEGLTRIGNAVGQLEGTWHTT
jgi:aspartate aminotransferase